MSCFASEKRKIVLGTTVVYISDRSGHFQKGRAILDSGSMCCCITSNFADLLGLKKLKVNIPISGISGCAVNIKKKINTLIANEDRSFSAGLDFLIVPKITDLLPVTKLDISNLEIPANIKLADPFFFEPGKIDLLIGA
ncbi:integrase catalytic domain-containing protein [Nephila pilipes]|uniref:Integrase catalytic domain-containing protein n=1 Tax=Nephila pilipes TaxID=299642 RepID=A0A8X6PPG2_NEPPI|nr:integrase catalytic domain-containing protein [Nephila pilipes]